MKSAAVVLSIILAPLAVLSSPAHAQGDMFHELQLLRDEVRQMSGQIEELRHELGQLKQRQLEDYTELDRRISPDAGLVDPDAIASTEPTPAVGAAATVPATIPQPESRAALPPPTDQPRVLVDSATAGDTAAAILTGDPVAEQASYDGAYNLLRQRRVDDAASAFAAYIDEYPQGRFVANAHYWLGEIHLLQNRLDDARQSFQTVKDKFPRDQKAEDAAYKLARVYHLQGEDQRARTLLQEVGAGNSNTAQLARDYLRDNF